MQSDFAVWCNFKFEQSQVSKNEALLLFNFTQHSNAKEANVTMYYLTVAVILETSANVNKS
jgi:hypothetical protein